MSKKKNALLMIYPGNSIRYVYKLMYGKKTFNQSATPFFLAEAREGTTRTDFGAGTGMSSEQVDEKN